MEKDNPDDSRRLQFLIQHCTGKAKDAIESCSNLPASEGYRVAKETLRENFRKPQIIAETHIEKLLNLPNLKNADGASLLGHRPKFQDFAKFIKERAKLVDNEFGQDMNSVYARETNIR